MLDYYEAYVNNPPVPGGCPVLNASIEADDSLVFLKDSVVSTIAMLQNSLVKIVERGIREGQIREDINAREFAIAFYATIEGAISLARMEGQGSSFGHVKKFLKRNIEEISN